jgi:hypothetical protein
MHCLSILGIRSWQSIYLHVWKSKNMNAITTISPSPPVAGRHRRSLVQYALLAAIGGFIVYTQVDLQPVFAPDQGYHVERIASDPWESPMVPDLNEEWYPMQGSPYGSVLTPAPNESVDPPLAPMFTPEPPPGELGPRLNQATPPKAAMHVPAFGPSGTFHRAIP